MGELSRRVARCGAMLALVTLLGALGAYAEDDPFEPPQNRIRPPGGVAASASDEPVVTTDPQIRILPPGGVAIRDSPNSGRIARPVEIERRAIDAFWTWLLSQVRVSLPVG